MHSDRGANASHEYQALLNQHGLVCSMSRKAKFWDNPVMERFCLNLKMERFWRRDYANHWEAKKDVHRVHHGLLQRHASVLKAGQFTADYLCARNGSKKPILMLENTWPAHCKCLTITFLFGVIPRHKILNSTSVMCVCVRNNLPVSDILHKNQIFAAVALSNLFECLLGLDTACDQGSD